MRIAILEDSAPDAALTEAWLSGAGHECRVFAAALELQAAYERENFDLLLLDWRLPDMDGDKVLQWVRQRVGWDLPVIFVTGRGNSDDIVAMLDAGADDYVTKPVDYKQLLARIAALGRRAARPRTGTSGIHTNGISVDADGHRILVDGTEVELTPKEFALASALLGNIGTLLNRQDLLREIWGYGDKINTRTIDVHISRLRKKLALTSDRGWRLTSVHHAGYRLDRVELEHGES